ncbi:spore wall protein 2-like [Colletotrichum higginsianum]|nr:spore wall protein 2-like [Colletotrichum higginsianum]
MDYGGGPGAGRRKHRELVVITATAGDGDGRRAVQGGAAVVVAVAEAVLAHAALHGLLGEAQRIPPADAAAAAARLVLVEVQEALVLGAVALARDGRVDQLRRLLRRLALDAPEDEDARDEDHEQQHEGEDGVDDEEHDADGANDDAGGAKDVCEDEQEDRVDKVDGEDGDVERVGRLVHEGAEHADGDEGGGLEDDEGDGLADADALAEGDDGGLGEDVADEGHDEVVGRGAVLHVQEPPLVDDGRVREEHVGRVLVRQDGLLGDADDLERGPDEGEERAEEEDDGQHDERRGVGLHELPEAQHRHLREPDEAQPEQDALERRLPVAPELEEAVAPGPVVLGRHGGAVAEGGDAEHGEEHEGAVDDEARQEQVGRLDLGAEGDALDAVDDVGPVLELDVGAPGQGAQAAADGAGDGALRHLDRDAPDRVQQAGGLAAGGALVPGLDDGRHVDAAEADEGLGLEVAEQREGVGGEVGGGVGVAHGGDDAGGPEAEAGDDGGGPLDADEVDGLAVGEVGLDAGDGLVRVGEVDEGADGGVEVRDGVGDARHGVELVADVEGELHVDLAGLHRAEALQVGGARVDDLPHMRSATSKTALPSTDTTAATLAVTEPLLAETTTLKRLAEKSDSFWQLLSESDWRIFSADAAEGKKAAREKT